MALIRSKELAAMQPADLQSKMTELQKELMKEQAQIAAGTTPKSPGRVRQVKKTIAKIKQLLGKEGIKRNE